MSRDWMSEYDERQDQQAANRITYFHGILRPLITRYYKWGEEVGGVKQPSTEVSQEEFDELPLDEQGRVQGGGIKIIFEIDPAPVHPEWEKLTSFEVFLDFPDWRKTTMPSIRETVGLTKGALTEFKQRAETAEWFIEGEVVKVPRRNDASKLNWVPKFTRMTQDVNELRAWNEERYPRPKVQVPESVVSDGKNMFIRLAKRDTAKFEQMVEQDDELRKYKPELLGMVNSWS